MNLRSLLHRPPADSVPLLPTLEPEDRPATRLPPPLLRRARAAAEEERLERLLTPSELDLVMRHEV